MVHSDRKIKGSPSCTIICAYFILKVFLCENAICILPLVYISSKTHRVSNNFLGDICAHYFVPVHGVGGSCCHGLFRNSDKVLAVISKAERLKLLTALGVGSLFHLWVLLSLILGTNLRHKAQLKFSYLIFLWLCTRFPSPKVSTALILNYQEFLFDPR